MNREEMLQRLSALDFYLIDMNLYLNTHPNDRDAIQKFNAVAREAMELREQYQQQFGMLMPHHGPSKTPWQWIEDPWPWQYQFNFDLTGDER